MATLVRPISANELIADLGSTLKCAPGNAIDLTARVAYLAGSGVGTQAWIRRSFKLGAACVVFRDLKSIDGRLTRNDVGAYEIELHSRRPRTRQLFSLAHELGHLLLEKQLPYLASGAKERSLFHTDYNAAEERVVDQLAAAMLMPRAEVRVIADSYKSPLTATIQIARAFCVSLSTAAIRLGEVTGTRLTMIEFCRKRPDECLRYADGPLWRLPFSPHEGKSWSIESAKARLPTMCNRVERVVLPVEIYPGIIDDYACEFRWLSELRAVAAFEIDRYSRSS